MQGAPVHPPPVGVAMVVREQLRRAASSFVLTAAVMLALHLLLN